MLPTPESRRQPLAPPALGRAGHSRAGREQAQPQAAAALLPQAHSRAAQRRRYRPTGRRQEQPALRPQAHSRAGHRADSDRRRHRATGRPPTGARAAQGQLAEFRFYEGQEMQIKEKIVPLKVWLAFLCLIAAHQQTVSGPLVFLYSHEWSLNIQVTAYEC